MTNYKLNFHSEITKPPRFTIFKVCCPYCGEIINVNIQETRTKMLKFVEYDIPCNNCGCEFKVEGDWEEIS